MKSFVLEKVTDTEGNQLDVFITDGLIAETPGPNAEVINCAGLIVLPGFVDLHTHLREPGFEQSETVLSGSRSAASGGFTAVHAMANTFPVADTAGVVEQIQRLGDEAGYVQVQPVGAVTVGLRGEQLAELGAMANSRAKVRLFSDDGNCVFDPLLMRRALEYVKAFDGTISQHAQEPRLTQGAQMNESALSAKLGLAGWPAVAEESIIYRDVLLTELTGSRLHVCHVSTAGSVEIIRKAKANGIRVTAEVTPHHLLLTEELASGYDPIFKVNPPLRKQSDVLALREGLIDGTIDAVATDHAPHPKESKDCEWAAAAFGMVGLETAFAVAHQVLIESGLSNYERLAEVMSTRPAQISGLANQGGYLKKSMPANLTLIDASSNWTAQPGTNSLSTNNPFSGMEFRSKVVHTIYGGRFTYRSGELVELEG